MTTRAEIEALIKRLEEAREGSEELDSAVYWAMSEWRNLGGFWREHKLTGERERFSYERCPKISTSVDAALSLVPQGWMVGEFRDEEGGCAYARLLKINDEETDAEAFGNSRPLALCIASLRARLSSMKDDANG